MRKTLKTVKAAVLRDVTAEEKLNVSGGAGAFLQGGIVDSVGDLAPNGGGSTAAFPVSISNARFTQSATTLCNWNKCSVYISGC